MHDDDHPAHGAAAGDSDESNTGNVDRLGPDSRGQWLITTVGSQHLWDCDTNTYLRIPGTGRPQFPYDQHPVTITRVDAWPAVGSTFFLWFDDPVQPVWFEHYRRSSLIASIEPFRPTDSEGEVAGEGDG